MVSLYSQSLRKTLVSSPRVLCIYVSFSACWELAACSSNMRLFVGVSSMTDNLTSALDGCRVVFGDVALLFAAEGLVPNKCWVV